MTPPTTIDLTAAPESLEERVETLARWVMAWVEVARVQDETIARLRVATVEAGRSKAAPGPVVTISDTPEGAGCGDDPLAAPGGNQERRGTT